MPDPSVSVVMAVYNGEKGLSQTLDSLRAQTFRDFELVAIDDGSTDQTWAIISAIDDLPVRAHRNVTNQGQTASLNHGIALARGKYIARHDAEDISAPDRLEKQAAFLDTHPDIVAVGSQLDWVDAAGKLIRHFDYPTAWEEINERLKTKNSFAHGSVMARREALLRIGGYREEFRLAQDYDLWLRLAEKHRMANLPETLYQMRFSVRMASVAKNDLQNACADLARRLAEERHEHGTEQSNLSAEAAAIKAAYKRGFLASRIKQAENLVNWAERLQWWGEPASRHAWAVWRHALRSWPLHWRVWKFAGREIRDLLAGKKE